MAILNRFEIKEFVSCVGIKKMEIDWDMNNEELIKLSLYRDISCQGSIKLCPKKLFTNLNRLIETKAGKILSNPLHDFEIRIDEFYTNHERQKIEVEWNDCNENFIVLTLWYGDRIYDFISFCPEKFLDNLCCFMEAKTNYETVAGEMKSHT